MNILDINTFYYGSDGGIKTFYDAKMKWFSSHPEHTYTLIHPGKKHRIRRPSPNVQVIEVFGLTGIIGKNRLLMLDYFRVYRMIQKIRPDIIEAGDPLLTSIFLTLLRKFKLIRCQTTCFHHSDPINTYIRPWAYGKRGNGMKRLLARICLRLFLATHRHYDHSLVASDSIRRRLEKLGLRRINVFPFGVDTIFRDTARLRSNGEKKILFIGRLEHEKGIYLVKDILPRLLEMDGVEVGIIGKGAHENHFRQISRRNFRYYGYIRNRVKVASILREYAIFLAPGPYETFGIAVLEAVTNGMIVVGADKGGTGEILSSMGSEFAFKAHDSEAFIQSVTGALNADIESESRKALHSAGSFLSWEESISDIIRFYQARQQSAVIFINEQKSSDFVA